MRSIPALLAAVLVLGSLVLPVPSLSAQGIDHHGADSTFSVEGLTVMWAVLRAADEHTTQVYLKLVKTTPRADEYQFFSVLSVDPFSGEVEEELRAARLEQENLIVRPRISFQYFSSRRLLFYRSREHAEQETADLVIYYLGIPDTTPEFTRQEELASYFTNTLRRLSGTSGSED